MARGINKVIVVGNLGSDPETRFMPNGGAVASFSIATSDSWTDKQSGQKQERTEWHNISVFGRLAEICGEYLRKGSKVYVEGSLRTEKWQDKQGNDRYTTKIIAREMQMLDSRTGGTASFQGGQPAQQQSQPQQQGGFQGQQQGGYQQPAAQPAAPQQGGGFTPPAQQAPNSGFGSDDFDDDIPF